MSGRPAGGRKRLAFATPIACLALGLPGCLGLASGAAPRDWSLPPGLFELGDFGLRTVVYFSVFFAAFGAIRLASLLFPNPHPSVDDPGPAPPARLPADAPGPALRDRSPGAESSTGAVRRPDDGVASDGDRIGLAEPLYGFLPRPVQERLVRTIGYQALLYTKISILLSGAIGLLLAGSWEPASAADAIPPAVAIRIGAGGFLLAESAHRYLRFARHEVSGTLIGWLAHGAASLLRPHR